MLQIPCPFCGPRDHAEFAYGGDASRSRPPEGETDIATWSAYVFLRDNPRGRHQEYWQHVHGCRMWLCVTRDTVDQTIDSVVPGREHARRADDSGGPR